MPIARNLSQVVPVGKRHFIKFVIIHGLLFLDRSSGGLSLDASKSHVARGSIDRLRVSCGGPVAPAIIRRAQMRAAFQNLPGNSDLRLAGIEASVLASAAGIFRNAACLWRVCFMLWRIPV